MLDLFHHYNITQIIYQVTGILDETALTYLFPIVNYSYILRFTCKDGRVGRHKRTIY